MIEATEVAWQSRILRLVGAMSTTAAMGMIMGTNGVVLRPVLQGVARREGNKQEIAGLDGEQEAVGQTAEITMAETETATRNMTVTESETRTRT
jgi:type IV secretory pathway TrbF-like protein